MKNWVLTKNNQVLELKIIPVVGIQELREDIVKKCKQQKHRVIGFFGVNQDQQVKLYVLLADDVNSGILVSSSILDKNGRYRSITPENSAFHIFEREFYEEFGIEPLNHPWLKPVRYGKERFNKNQKIINYPFFEMTSEETHEVAVGPIHAGIIEPGHFRFVCNGEKIYHLEIQLGYQHRNIEKLFVKNCDKFVPYLAESIAGDTVVGHTTAYANAIESLAGVKITNKAEIIREIALELERIAIHIGDLGAIANDVAYLMGNAVFGATRTLVINTLLSICGSRFGRGLIRIGGVVFDIDEKIISKSIGVLEKVEEDVKRMADTMFSAPSVLSRLDNTGTVTKKNTLDLGLVGMTARASGVNLDVRTNHPYGFYKDFDYRKEYHTKGDVWSRTYLRYAEIIESIQIIEQLLKKLAEHKSEKLIINVANNLLPEHFAVSMVEGWRGEIVHAAITDKDGKLSRYKIKDPSFNNWFALAIAVRNNGISDFPLCNKSFNLSYSGNDL